MVGRWMKPLSKRESQVIRGVVNGSTQKEIARSLSISQRAVCFYLLNAREKYNAKSLYNLVALVVSDNPAMVERPSPTP